MLKGGEIFTSSAETQWGQIIFLGDFSMIFSNNSYFWKFLLKKSGKIMKMYGLKFDLGKISLPLLTETQWSQNLFQVDYFEYYTFMEGYKFWKCFAKSCMNSNATQKFENISWNRFQKGLDPLCPSRGVCLFPLSNYNGQGQAGITNWWM